MRVFPGKTFNSFFFFGYISARSSFVPHLSSSSAQEPINHVQTIRLYDAPMTDRAGSKRRMDSPASRSDSSPDPGGGSEQDVAAPFPYAYASPSPIAGTHPSIPEGDDIVVRARQLPLDRRQVPFLLCDSALRRSSPWGSMSGDTSNDPFVAYQKAAKSMSAKKGSASRTVSGDDLMITGSRQAMMVKIKPSVLTRAKKARGRRLSTRASYQSAEVVRSAGNLAAALSNLNLQVFPHDGTTLPSGKPLEVIHVLQGGLLRNISQLYHLGEQLSLESSSISREELEELKNQLSEEKAQRVARELQIRDLKDKIKDVERSAKISSADALSVGKKNQELEEVMENLRLETVMAVSGARITARWELMREWLHRKNDQWDLAKAFAQYKTVVLEEAKNKGAPVLTFENEPTIPPDSRMDIDSRPGGSSF
ncbi:hypothetical protein HID58_048064 [Brassica napus]|uniref:Uncharacterized protein n=1 Tax=Brassica napus TaxID=3708 RepID=A0ABQ8B145_BRANA|nr:hypothetical protein HID58_048064 [Brassica napus]